MHTDSTPLSWHPWQSQLSARPTKTWFRAKQPCSHKTGPHVLTPLPAIVDDGWPTSNGWSMQGSKALSIPCLSLGSLWRAVPAPEFPWDWLRLLWSLPVNKVSISPCPVAFLTPLHCCSPELFSLQPCLLVCVLGRLGRSRTPQTSPWVQSQVQWSGRAQKYLRVLTFVSSHHLLQTWGLVNTYLAGEIIFLCAPMAVSSYEDVRNCQRL